MKNRVVLTVPDTYHDLRKDKFYVVLVSSISNAFTIIILSIVYDIEQEVSSQSSVKQWFGAL